MDFESLYGSEFSDEKLTMINCVGYNKNKSSKYRCKDEMIYLFSFIISSIKQLWYYSSFEFLIFKNCISREMDFYDYITRLNCDYTELDLLNLYVFFRAYIISKEAVLLDNAIIKKSI